MACMSRGGERTRVTVETPAQLTLQARTSDGNVTLAGLQGELGLTTGDGDVNLDHVSGGLRIKSGDGHVKVTDAGGQSMPTPVTEASASMAFSMPSRFTPATELWSSTFEREPSSRSLVHPVLRWIGDHSRPPELGRRSQRAYQRRPCGCALPLPWTITSPAERAMSCTES